MTGRGWDRCAFCGRRQCRQCRPQPLDVLHTDHPTEGQRLADGFRLLAQGGDHDETDEEE